MNLDWRRMKAVVLQSDDWGLCAWVPDEQAHRVLADGPAFRDGAGRLDGRSTLETAADVNELAETLAAFRGGDGLPPVWQANTILAAPDWSQLHPPWFEVEALPLTGLDALPPRWARPGLLEAYTDAGARGLWWPELRGLHGLPETAWLRALRRGEHDARAAHEQQSPVCAATQESGEFDAREPRDVRTRELREAVARFTALFGRGPTSISPPESRFDDWLEDEAGSLGITVIQGAPVRTGGRLDAVRKHWRDFRFPQLVRGRLRMPPGIPYEPCDDARSERGGGPASTLAAALEAVHAAWAAGRPAVVNSHRRNYAHLDPAWPVAGRAALTALLGRLCAEEAIFLTDAEVSELSARGWSARATGPSETLLRHHGAAREPLRFAAPDGVTGARLRAANDGSPGGEGEIKLDAGTAEARINPGSHVIEWTRAK